MPKDIYDQAWKVAPHKVTDQLIVSQDIERRWGLVEQGNSAAMHKYYDLFTSPLPVDALSQPVSTNPGLTLDSSPLDSAVGEDKATLKRLQEAHDSLAKTSTAIEAEPPPKWLDGLKEDFVKRMLSHGFGVLSHEELLKQISINHPFAGMFLDAIKNAGVNSVLELIRPAVDRLAQQSLLKPEVLQPKIYCDDCSGIRKHE